MKRLALFLPFALAACTSPAEMLASKPDVVLDTTAKPEDVRDCFTHDNSSLVIHTTPSGFEVIATTVQGNPDAPASFAVKIDRTSTGSHLEGHKHSTLTGFNYDWTHAVLPCLDKLPRH